MPEKKSHRSYGLIREVRDARKTSPLTDEEQKALIKRYNEEYGELDQDDPKFREVVNSLVKELNGNDHGEQAMPTDHVVLAVEEESVNPEPGPVATPVLPVEPSEGHDASEASGDEAVITGEVDPVHRFNEAVVDSVHGIGGFFHSIGDKARGAWEDYTADVRIPVEDDASPIEPESTSSIIPSAYHTGREPARTPGVASKPPVGSTLPVTGDSAVDGANGVVKVTGKVRNVIGSFIDGVLGRPAGHVDDQGVPVIDGDHDCKYRRRLSWVMRLFAVIGGVAVVRASIDAFRPRVK